MIKTNKSVKVLTSKGVEINGNRSEVIDVLTSIGEAELANTLKPLYYSKSAQEYLVISDMATPHVRNASKKALIQLFSNLEYNTLLKCKKSLNALTSFLYLIKSENIGFVGSSDLALYSVTELLDELVQRLN